MTDYIVLKKLSRGSTRHLHVDPNCIALRNDRATREATPSEIDAYDECGTCTKSVDKSTQDWGPQQALREASQ